MTSTKIYDKIYKEKGGVKMEKGYNLIDTSKMLGIKASTARYWARTGKIRAQKISGTRRWIVMESEIKRLQNDVKD